MYKYYFDQSITGFNLNPLYIYFLVYYLQMQSVKKYYKQKISTKHQQIYKWCKWKKWQNSATIESKSREIEKLINLRIYFFPLK